MMEINSLASAVLPGTDARSYLPEHPVPWHIVFFRNALCAVHPELGCYLYHEQRWQLCIPVSDSPLVYDKQWYYNA